MDNPVITLKSWRKLMNYGRDKAYTAARTGRLKAFKGGNGAWVLPLSEITDFPIREANRQGQ